MPRSGVNVITCNTLDIEASSDAEHAFVVGL